MRARARSRRRRFLSHPERSRGIPCYADKDRRRPWPTWTSLHRDPARLLTERRDTDRPPMPAVGFRVRGDSAAPRGPLERHAQRPGKLRHVSEFPALTTSAKARLRTTNTLHRTLQQIVAGSMKRRVALEVQDGDRVSLNSGVPESTCPLGWSVELHSYGARRTGVPKIGNHESVVVGNELQWFHIEAVNPPPIKSGSPIDVYVMYGKVVLGLLARPLISSSSRYVKTCSPSSRTRWLSGSRCRMPLSAWSSCCAIDGAASKVKPASVAAQRIRRPIMVASWWKVRRTGAARADWCCASPRLLLPFSRGGHRIDF